MSKTLQSHTAGKLMVMDDQIILVLLDISSRERLISTLLTPQKLQLKSRTGPKVSLNQRCFFRIAISEDEISSTSILTSETGMSINTDVYISKCFRPNLLPFFSQENKPYLSACIQNTLSPSARASKGIFHTIFWPDLSSAHYSTKLLYS